MAADGELARVGVDGAQLRLPRGFFAQQSKQCRPRQPRGGQRRAGVFYQERVGSGFGVSETVD